jgi:hypothetical protein
MELEAKGGQPPLTSMLRPATRPSAVGGRGTLSALVVATAVVVVHGVHVSKPLFWDDYEWLSLSGHHGWATHAWSVSGGIYRPLVAFWFAGMRWVFGLSALPYHVAALAFLIAAALLVRVLALRIGMENFTATTSGVVYGAYGALTLTTIWAAAAGGELAVACSLAAIVVLFGPVAYSRQLLAALLFAIALLTRESSVVTPALALIALLAPTVTDHRPGRAELGTALRKTALLWLIALAYLAVRFATGAPFDRGPYAARLMGTHVFRNMLHLMQDAARFGTPSAASIAKIWDVVFWGAIVVASLLVLRRGRLVPLAGLVWFAIACLPEVTLTKHGMDPYYLALPLVGLALTIASLLRFLVRSDRLMVGAVVFFVVVQVFAVQWYDRDSGIERKIRRSEALSALAKSQPVDHGVMTIRTHCPEDRDISKGGLLMQVVRDRPDLRVRFEVLEPPHC